MNHLSRLLIVGSCLLQVMSCGQNNANSAKAIDTLTDSKTNADTKDNTKTAEPDSLLYAAGYNNSNGWMEDFSASKPGYAAATVQLKTGKWYIADALIGTDESGTSGDNKSVRIRNNGKLSMQFDVNRADTVTIHYAVYGKDEPSGWQLWLSTDGGASYTPVKETITASSTTPQKAEFAINKTGKLRFEIRKVSGGKNRLVIQDMTIGTGASPEGNSTTNNSNPTNQTQDDSNMLLGNPTNAIHSTASPDNYLVDHQYYVISYSRKKGTPNWVSWHIGAADLGNTDRVDNFRPDKSLPGGWYEVDANSYKNSGFDKGHNCPSGDRTASKDANSSTFFMDNIVPQAPNNNQHTWEHLESYCRDQVKKGNEVYVIMGNYGSGGTGNRGYTTTIDNGKINVPAHIWKVVVILPNGNHDLQRINNNTSVIAIDTPNDNAVSSNWMDYVVTVSDIEKATGCDLLSALPKPIQKELESKKFKGSQ